VPPYRETRDYVAKIRGATASPSTRAATRVFRTVQIALPEHLQTLIDELVDNQAAQVWLQQEGAFHLGVAIGLRLAKLPPPEPGEEREDEDEDEDEDDELP